MSEELKACRCGGAELIDWCFAIDRTKELRVVGCQSCGLAVIGPIQSDLYGLWNLRATPEIVVPMMTKEERQAIEAELAGFTSLPDILRTAVVIYIETRCRSLLASKMGARPEEET